MRFSQQGIGKQLVDAILEHNNLCCTDVRLRLTFTYDRASQRPGMTQLLRPRYMGWYVSRVHYCLRSLRSLPVASHRSRPIPVDQSGNDGSSGMGPCPAPHVPVVLLMHSQTILSSTALGE